MTVRADICAAGQTNETTITLDPLDFSIFNLPMLEQTGCHGPNPARAVVIANSGVLSPMAIRHTLSACAYMPQPEPGNGKSALANIQDFVTFVLPRPTPYTLSGTLSYENDGNYHGGARVHLSAVGAQFGFTTGGPGNGDAHAIGPFTRTGVMGAGRWVFQADSSGSGGSFCNSPDDCHFGSITTGVDAILSFGTCVSITSQPSPASICTADGMVTLTVAAESTGTLSYQWRRNSTPIDTTSNPTAATPMLVLTRGQSPAGNYSCRITDDQSGCPAVTTTIVSVSFALCPADFNCSNAAPTVQDIFDFLAAYFAGDPRTDFNHSGIVSVQDIFDFLAAYFAGCS